MLGLHTWSCKHFDPPKEEDYKVYYAQSLYAASLYQEAMKVN